MTEATRTPNLPDFTPSPQMLGATALVISHMWTGKRPRAAQVEQSETILFDAVDALWPDLLGEDCRVIPYLYSFDEFIREDKSADPRRRRCGVTIAGPTIACIIGYDGRERTGPEPLESAYLGSSVNVGIAVGGSRHVLLPDAHAGLAAAVVAALRGMADHMKDRRDSPTAFPRCDDGSPFRVVARTPAFVSIESGLPGSFSVRIFAYVALEGLGSGPVPQ